MEGGHIVYAEPGHPEYRRDPVDEFLVVCAEEAGVTDRETYR